jgi:hypothetical protein
MLFVLLLFNQFLNGLLQTLFGRVASSLRPVSCGRDSRLDDEFVLIV